MDAVTGALAASAALADAVTKPDNDHRLSTVVPCCIPSYQTAAFTSQDYGRRSEGDDEFEWR
jgi:hypothetical protein